MRQARFFTVTPLAHKLCRRPFTGRTVTICNVRAYRAVAFVRSAAAANACRVAVAFVRAVVAGIAAALPHCLLHGRFAVVTSKICGNDRFRRLRRGNIGSAPFFAARIFICFLSLKNLYLLTGGGKCDTL